MFDILSILLTPRLALRTSLHTSLCQGYAAWQGARIFVFSQILQIPRTDRMTTENIFLNNFKDSLDILQTVQVLRQYVGVGGG